MMKNNNRKNNKDISGEQKLRWVGSLSLTDEKYLDEADPDGDKINRGRKRSAKIKNENPKKKWFKAVIAAATLCTILIAFGIFLFLPYQRTGASDVDISRFEGSEYYELIKKLSTYYDGRSYVKGGHKYANNFEKLADKLFGSIKDSEYIPNDATAFEVGGTYDSNKSSDHKDDIIDHQVAGVIEGDIIKKTDKYIFYLAGLTKVLYVYTIDGAASREIGSYSIYELCDESESDFEIWSCEMYLTDNDTLVLLSVVRRGGQSRETVISVFDVGATEEKILQKKKMIVSGDYMSSRLTDGKLLLFTSFFVGRSRDYSDVESFVPSVDTCDGSGRIPLPSEAIFIPEQPLQSASYTIITDFDIGTFENRGSYAFLDCSDEIYVSAENIYMMSRAYNSASDCALSEKLRETLASTDIIRISYAGEKLEEKQTLTVPGTIKNRYFLDERDGVLRVAVQRQVYHRIKQKENGKLFELDKTEEEILKKNGSNAGLYCYDIESGRLLACVEDFTEYGELVDSVRYNGNYAYVCTARHATEQHDVNLDPVFFFDLSDLNNITYKDTGEIDGYSTSLVDFGNGYLLGIGVGASPDVFKLEVYTETADGVVPVCKYELANTRYSEDYKSYYINRDKNMLGIGLTGSPENTYVLFELTEGCIISATEIIPIHAAPGNMRGFIEDGWLYVMGEGDFKVVELK